MSKKTIGIHWFRRDLRIFGNPGLRENFLRHKKNVVCLFCFDQEFLSRDDFSHNRFQFFLNTLKELKNDLIKIGSDLIIINEEPTKAFPHLIELFEKSNQFQLDFVSFCRDYEPFAINRDEKIQQILSNKNISWENFRDHLIVEPWELSKNNDDEGYKVYTPFKNKWLTLLEENSFKERIQYEKKSIERAKSFYQNDKFNPIFDLKWNTIFSQNELKDSLETFIEKNNKNVDISIPKAGTKEALNYIEKFQQSIQNYGEKRDIPSENGTSRLSMFFKNGSITTAMALASFDIIDRSCSKEKIKWFQEIIWREFYYHILYRHPFVENSEFNKTYKNMKWKNDKNLFFKWKNGQTGYPIVDAGMRELKTTGFMHNRVRMIVSSFLTKHLLIDWRWGEQYFMEKLLDGDMAPNNGGWQWAASTGCDAQPYFRIFNPWIQSKKFDKDGAYIKKYVEELKDLDAKKLHEPILAHKTYPKPIVEHKEAREKALEYFKKISSKS